MVPTLLSQNENFLIINKPSGMVVHGARVNANKKIARAPESTLVDWLVEHYPEIRSVGDDPVLRPGIVHRLDKDTSGIMVIARNQTYFEYLKSLFQNHKVHKTYLALVLGIPKNDVGIIDKPIGIMNGTLKRSVRSKKMAKAAITEYRVIKKFNNDFTSFIPNRAERLNGGGVGSGFALIHVYPKTGRTHQIRVHLASIGHPIVGDTLYGRKSKNKNVASPWFHDRLMLHAMAIEFPERDGMVVHFESSIPEGFNRLLK
jgi:23S rRNA pseudouridine1911/1915/1917 synthase